MRTGERNGRVVGAISVREDDEIMLTTAFGKMVRTPVKGISVIGRATQGVRVHALDEGDRVVSVAKVIPETNGVEDQNGGRREAEGPAAPAETPADGPGGGGDSPEA